MVQRNLQLLLAVRLSFPSIPVAPIWRSRLKRNLSFWQDIGHTGSTMEQEAWKAEVPSFDQLYMLLSQTIEVISFVLLLVDYKIGDVVAGSISLFCSVSHCSLVFVYHQQVPFWPENDKFSGALQRMLNSLIISWIIMYLQNTPEILVYSRDWSFSRDLIFLRSAPEIFNFSGDSQILQSAPGLY